MVAAIHGHTDVLVRDEYDCRGPESLSKCQHKSFVVIVHRYILSGHLCELMSIFGHACGIFSVLVAANYDSILNSGAGHGTGCDSYV